MNDTPQSVTLPRELIERTLTRLNAAAHSAAEHGALMGAEIYRRHMRELETYLHVIPERQLTPAEEAIEAGLRG